MFGGLQSAVHGLAYRIISSAIPNSSLSHKFYLYGVYLVVLDASLQLAVIVSCFQADYWSWRVIVYSLSVVSMPIDEPGVLQRLFLLLSC